MECINKECSGKASEDTCYLCPKCYAEQKDQELNGTSAPATNKNISQAVVPKNPNLQLHLNQPYEKCRSNLAEAESTDSLDNDVDEGGESPPSTATGSKLPRQNTMIETGMSKFYTLEHEDHCLNMVGDNARLVPLAPPPPSMLNNEPHYTVGAPATTCLNNARTTIQREHNETRGSSAPSAAVELARSSFYDQPLSFEARAHPVAAATRRQDRHFVVNNLRNEWQEKENVNQREKHYSKHAPLAKEYTNEVTHAVTGASPPTRKQAATSLTPPTGATAAVYHDESHDALRHNDVDQSSADQGKAGYQQALEQVKPKTITIKQENLATHAMPAKAGVLQRACKQGGCPYFGTIATDFYCSACFKRLQKELATKASQRH